MKNAPQHGSPSGGLTMPCFLLPNLSMAAIGLFREMKSLLRSEFPNPRFLDVRFADVVRLSTRLWLLLSLLFP
jgi:hypothetical protein